jgi:amino acid adenylation domain-containing protein
LAEAPSAKFDLSLSMSERSNGLSASAVYNVDLFDAATVERMLGHLGALLEGAARDPDARLGELPLLGEAERDALLAWSRARASFPRDATIHAIFARQAAATPEAIAVAFGPERLTYRELDRRANRLAHHLRARGVGPETPVGLYARRSCQMVVAALAILKAGGAYLPLDPEAPDARLAFLLADARAAVVVTAGTGVQGRALGPITVVDLAADAPRIDAEPDGEPAPIGAGESLAYLMYTSGSTGEPKGVCALHRGVVRLVHDHGYARFAPDEVFLQLAPLAFDASTLEIWGPLLHGGKLVVFPAEPPTPALLGEVIREHGVTTLWLTAGFFNAVIDERPEALGALRRLLAGGEALSVPHVQKALRLLPGVTLVNGYGPTEGTTFTTCHPITSAESAVSVPIGRPVAGTTVYVLDQERQLVPVGVPGELYVGGDGLAGGYLHRPDLTAERFVPDPFSAVPGARLYRTGDRVRWLSDGTLAFLGRLDLQVKLRGFRIELGEIEAALGSHPDVDGCAVIVREDAPGVRRLVAYVVPGASRPEEAILRRWLDERLPPYMVPGAFVLLAALPLTPNGKVDRRALPAPEAPGNGDGEAPRTPTEAAIVSIWQDLLAVPRVGVDHDFFALGGHSLLAMQVMARLSATLPVDLSVAALFELRTVANLAAIVDAVLTGQRGAPAAAGFEEGEI